MSENIQSSFLSSMSEDDFFRHIQSAYLRGVDFSSEIFGVDDENYQSLWAEYVPKAAFDYTDKLVSGLTDAAHNTTQEN